MQRHIQISYVLFLSALIISCTKLPKEDAEQQAPEVERIIEEVRKAYAPDKRVMIFDISYQKNDNGIILTGETMSREALKSLKERLKEEQDLKIENKIALLPSHDLGDSIYGLVNNAVGNIRSQDKHSAELATQALLGTPLRILKRSENKEWYLVQTPDGYISWLDHGALYLTTATTIKQWKKAEKLVFKANIGVSTKACGGDEVVSDMVFGSIVKSLGREKDCFKIQYPDERIAYLKKSEVITYEDWLTQEATSSLVVNKAFEMHGFPYLWGGTSMKGIDCSGFTKTAYQAAGLIIPRDASQQIHAGDLVDDKKEFDRLLPGDLLFFGRPKTDSTRERVVHVGIWIGDSSMIHSSGRVHVSSFNPSSARYDAFNLNRYLRSKRLLATDAQNVLDLRKTDLYSWWD